MPTSPTLDGRRLVDFRAHNLHLVSYSVPVRARMSLDELRPHLHTLPDHPDWIPYRTAYYARTWGFCLTHPQLDALGPGPFEVVIDSSIASRGAQLWRAGDSRGAQPTR